MMVDRPAAARCAAVTFTILLVGTGCGPGRTMGGQSGDGGGTADTGTGSATASETTGGNGTGTSDTGPTSASSVGSTQSTSRSGTVTGAVTESSSSVTTTDAESTTSTSGSTTGGIPWEELTEEECLDAGGYPVGAWPIVPFDGEPGYCKDYSTFIDYIGCSIVACPDNSENTLCAEDAPDIPVYQTGQDCEPVGYVEPCFGQIPACAS